MIDYLYDGSFQGLLTCVYAHYYDEHASGIYPQDSYQSTLFGSFRVIETDPERSDIVYRAIDNKISRGDLRAVYRVFCSDAPEKENIILNYLRLGFSVGGEVSLLHGNPIVAAFRDRANFVSGELERYRGILRFEELQGKVLYAPIEPESDLAEFLAPYFCSRLREESFIIHDVRRGKAAIASRGKWFISDFTDDVLPDLHEDEKEFRRLWKTYFDRIAIRQRTNHACQRNFLPQKYRAHLTEMKPSAGRG